ncbi:MAG TPA: tetratricopeptide repeat protein [Candidatus Polarisedimenticolia bacterium]|jgi:tetratricopeptide (TPR) repeat protein|nr:tetratricopeptide repeat protein [Candidatus Polarisedimenticolia bacterium]
MAFDRAKALANAEKSVKAGKIPEAIAEYRKLAEDNSRDMGVINKLGDLCVRAGKNQDAIRYFLRIAEYYAADGFFLKAIAMYKKISKLDPANIDCLQKLAGLYQQQGLTIEAKAQYLAVADRHVKSGQVKKALEVFPRILEIEPDNIKVRMSYADMLVRSGSVPEAGREFRVVAQELAKKGMLDEAIKVAQKGTKLVPGDADMMSLVLSLTKEAERSPGELLATVVQVAKANGDNPRSLALLGEAYLAAGKTADAEKVFQKLRGMKDAPPEVAAAVARFYISKDDADSALDWVSRAAEGYLAASKATDGTGLLDEYLRAFPNHPGGLEKKAAIAEGAGDKPARFEALLGLAEVRLHAGDAGGAAGFITQMQGVDPQHPKCAELLERVTHLKGGVAKAAPARGAAPARPAPAAVQDIQEGALVLDESTPIEVEEEDEAEAEEETSGADALGDVEDEVGPHSRIQDMAAEPDEEGIEAEDEDFISEHFTEAEVFVKYGLLEKAKEQLLKILAKYERHIPSHTKLKEIYYEEGDKEKAVSECLTLANILKTKNRAEEAQDQLNEAIRIDPNNPRLRQLTVQPASPSAPAGEDKGPPPAAKAPAAKRAPERAAAAPPAKPARPDMPAPKAVRPAPAPAPELEIEEMDTVGDLEIEPTAQPEAPEAVVEAEPDDSGLELEIEMPDEPAPTKPAVTPPAPRPAPASRTAAAPAPAKVEEETPEDMAGGMSLGDLGDEFTIEVEDVGSPAPVPAGSDQTAAVAAIGSRDPDAEKLGEVDFYIDQGLLEEARAVLFQLQKQHPGSQEVAQRFERANRPVIEIPPPAARAPEPGGLDLDVERAFGAQTMVIQAPRVAPPAEVPRAARAKPVFRVEKQQEMADGDFFDLAGELDRSLAEAQVAVDTQDQESLEGPGHSIDEIFRAFKKGVEQQVDSQDYETHYNLGIAYKEMGLVDEAIGEFQYAARDPGRMVECCGILGLCFREKGMPQLALKWYQKGLDTPSLGEHEAIGLRYDIAEVHREQGEYKKAMHTFSEVYGMDSTYRDVAAKIKELKKLLG